MHRRAQGHLLEWQQPLSGCISKEEGLSQQPLIVNCSCTLLGLCDSLAFALVLYVQSQQLWVHEWNEPLLFGKSVSLQSPPTPGSYSLSTSASIECSLSREKEGATHLLLSTLRHLFSNRSIIVHWLKHLPNKRPQIEAMWAIEWWRSIAPRYV